jgi:hypothetical protein
VKLFCAEQHFNELIVVPGFVKGSELRALLDFCWNTSCLYIEESTTFVLDKSVGVYHFGQEKRRYSDVMIGYPDPIMNLTCEIAERFGETLNHCIVVAIAMAKEHHIPWHSDKQEGTDGAGDKDICAFTNICNIIIFEDEDGTKENHKLQAAYPEDIDANADGHGDARKYLYNKRTKNVLNCHCTKNVLNKLRNHPVKTPLATIHHQKPPN